MSAHICYSSLLCCVARRIYAPNIKLIRDILHNSLKTVDRTQVLNLDC